MIDGQIERILPLPVAISISPTQRGPATVLSSDSTKVYFCNEASSVYRISLLDGNVDFIVGDKIHHQPEIEENEIVSYDGFHVKFHHLKPAMARELGILFVVGGPGERIDSDDSILLKLFNEGYEVIVPAYRGCAGYGQDYKNANKGLYGKGDVEDIIACAKDWKIRNDNRPLAIVGYSYGGFLTFLSMAHNENPFEKGATLWGVTSLEHMGSHLPRAYPKDPVEKQEAKMKRNLLNLAQNIKRPLLVIHGGLDTMSTNEEVLTIKREIDKHEGVCNVIIYEDGAHGLANYRKELFKELLSFLER